LILAKQKEIQLILDFQGMDAKYKRSTVNSIDLGVTVNVDYEDSYSAEGTK
jgi:hypothetical protein